MKWLKLYYGNLEQMAKTLLWKFRAKWLKLYYENLEIFMKRKIKINKKIKSDLKKYPMVECRWLDIVSDASWQSMDNLKNTKLATCITKGHLLSQTKGITRIFGDYSLKDNSKTDIEEVGNTTVIPNSVIVEIKKI
jgi:hypothetical protein